MSAPDGVISMLRRSERLWRARRVRHEDTMLKLEPNIADFDGFY